VNGYTENGCKEAEQVAGKGVTCENCPFEKCRYEFEAKRPLLEDEDIRKVQSMLEKNINTTLIASQFGVSQRTIQRVKSGKYAGIKV